MFETEIVTPYSPYALIFSFIFSVTSARRRFIFALSVSIERIFPSDPYLMLTSFSSYPVIASLIAIGGLVYLIIRLIIQIIIALVVLAILGGSAGKTVYRDGSGNLYEKDTFGNLRRLK